MKKDKINQQKSATKEDEIIIQLDGIKYKISTTYSLSDLQLYHKSLSENNNPKLAFCVLIHHKLSGYSNNVMPTIEKLVSEKEEIFDRYIELFLTRNSNLMNFYSESDKSLTRCERFAIANNKYLSNFSENLIETFKSIMNSIEQINKNLYDSFSKIQDNLINIASDISNAISKLNIPYQTEEEKLLLQQSYTYWGSKGWTLIPGAPLGLFNTKPSTKKDCDKIALSYLKPKDINELFSYLLNSNICNKDIKSSIFCFENKQYKACCLLLFGIIDSCLIEQQKSSSNNNHLLVGNRAVKAFENKLKDKYDMNEVFSLAFYYENLIECLHTYFSFGNNFKDEPNIINRNYVSHGMNKRNVQKKDCIQLFLALYNVFDFIYFF